MKTCIAVLALGLSFCSGALAYNPTTLNCTADDSFESFELTPPARQGTGYFLHIVDMAQLEPQELILQGRVDSSSFEVAAKQPNFRTGQIDMGRMVGRKGRGSSWEMIWYAAKPTLNGQKVLKFSCEP